MLEKVLRDLQLIYSSTDFPLYKTWLSDEEKRIIWYWAVEVLSKDIKNSPVHLKDILIRYSRN